MLMPKFSIRWILALFTVLAVFFSIIAAAVRGQAWAIAFSVASAGMVVMFLVHAIVYLVAWWVSLVHCPEPTHQRTQSPFAGNSMPPQLLRPEEPE